MSRYVLDSFAVLAAYWGEPGHELVRQLLADGRNQFWMSSINVGEVYYQIARKEHPTSAKLALDRLMASERISYVDANISLALSAAELKSDYTLSYADCFAAALARQVDAAIVTGDREFARLEADGVVDVEWLPYRGRSRR